MVRVCFGAKHALVLLKHSIKVISPRVPHLLKLTVSESPALTPTLGDVADPGQGLVSTFLNDLHVTDLEGNKKEWPRIREAAQQ